MKSLTAFAMVLGVSVFAAATTTGCASADEDAQSDDDLTSDAKRVEAIRKVAAKDVEVSHVTFAASVKAPKASPSSGYRSSAGPSLYGVDWFQKWPGGLNADHGWDNGTEFGKRCMWAANLRFEAIMKDPPAELKAFLRSYTSWSGSFYNWVNDYSKPESSGDASEATLWAWRTSLSKWISAAAKDGSCYLPTRKMVVDYVAACKDHVASNGGQMEGCSL